MMRNSIVLLLFLVGLESVLGSVVTRYYHLMTSHVTWADAQKYCRSTGNYIDLATAYSQTDVNNMDLSHYYAWMGFYRTSTDSTWRFSAGNPQSNIRTWANLEPEEQDLCVVAHYPNKLAYGTNCDSLRFTYCDYFDDSDDHRIAFVSRTMTWFEAREYCRTYYREVAYMHSNNASPQNFPVWIGLYREGGTWSWSTGENEYTQWATGQPGTGDCATITSLSKRIVTQDCSSLYPFTCFWDNLVLVKENKTWEEALEHCRSMGTNPNNPDIHYRLVSIQPGHDHAYMRFKIKEATTDKVWVGLRFLVDQWRWVNGAAMLFSDLPDCPVEQRCGAMSTNINSTVEPMDCLDTNNFLCYI